MGMDDHIIKADLSATDGTLDLTLEAPLPALNNITLQSSIVNNYDIDSEWNQVKVPTNPLLGAQCHFPKNVVLSRGKGPVSSFLGELGISSLLRMDVLKDAQMVLHMPQLLNTSDNVKL